MSVAFPPVAAGMIRAKTSRRGRPGAIGVVTVRETHRRPDAARDKPRVRGTDFGSIFQCRDHGLESRGRPCLLASGCGTIRPAGPSLRCHAVSSASACRTLSPRRRQGRRPDARPRLVGFAARPSGRWPQPLRTVVGLLLQSRFPMFVAWGDELGFLYNDPYAEILGAKHPRALGRRFHDIWSEIWPDISPLIDAAMAGQATYREDLPLRDEPQGLRRADLVHLLLFAGARRERQGRRHVLRVLGDDATGARRAGACAS